MQNFFYNFNIIENNEVNTVNLNHSKSNNHPPPTPAESPTNFCFQVRVREVKKKINTAVKAWPAILNTFVFWGPKPRIVGWPYVMIKRLYNSLVNFIYWLNTQCALLCMFSPDQKQCAIKLPCFGVLFTLNYRIQCIRN